MGNTATFAEKWKGMRDKLRPGMQAAGRVFSLIGNWIFRLRKVLLSIPVLVAAIYLAVQNMKLLPEQVGINLLSTGEFAQTISRNVAVIGPLGLTALCLMLMVISRRTIYPWLISVFTLVLPIFIRLTNVYLG
jgi:hypothetical protein